MTLQTLPIQSLTFGYSDSEDRLWIRLILQNGNEAGLWITRRLMKIIFLKVGQLLQDTFEKIELPIPITNDQRLLLEFEEALRLDPDPNPPSPAERKPQEILQYRICTALEIKVQGSNWMMTWKTGSEPSYSMICDRTFVHRLLISLYKQQKRGEWDIDLSNLWLSKLLSSRI